MAAHDDLDLMQLLDGELDPAEARALTARVESDDDEQRKLQAMRQVGESVRTHLELAADEAEPRLEALWGNIERRITANGADRASSAAPAPVPATRPARDARGEGAWAGLRRWWAEYRAHFFTSAVTAGAVAALILVLRPASQRTIVRTVEVAPPPTTSTVPAVAESTPPAVDYLDVTDGSGTVMTLDRDDDDDSAATVIWVTRDKMEDPI